MTKTKESLKQELKYYRARLYRQRKRLEKLEMFKNSDSNFVQYLSRRIAAKKRYIKNEIEEMQDTIIIIKKEISEIQ
jgi:hypothetical protein